MYGREVAKAKTAAKSITYEGSELKHIVLTTIKNISKLVGSTLGPNGKLVLIERQENLPPFTTKDGITVFNSMCFANPVAQAVLEAARDSSSKTNTEAGDGTTSATILAESLIKYGFEHLEANPRLSTQKIVREMEECYDKFVLPFIQKSAKKITQENSDDFLLKVARIATNNDFQMSKAVLDAFDIVGHNGNMTVVEAPGASGFATEKIEGFPIASGFEDSCGRFIEEFINDRGGYRSLLEKPLFVLYNGQINDISLVLTLMEQVGNYSDPQYMRNYNLQRRSELVNRGYDNDAIEDLKPLSPNVVLVAANYSDSVLATLAQNFKAPHTLNVLPLKIPLSQQANSHYHFLQDLQAFTGAKIFDPLSAPLSEADAFKDLGLSSMEVFEFGRYKSLILGDPDEMLITVRAEELEKQLSNPASDLDKELTSERLGILTQGIAKIKVYGSSESELKEKRHRVEDAIAAVKGAIKYGVLPGGAKTLIVLSQLINESAYSDSVKEIMGKAFLEPFVRLLENAGHTNEEIDSTYESMLTVGRGDPSDFFYTYDVLNGTYGDAVAMGVLDSAAAVTMAIKNSLSVAKMLMGLSGIVVFKRDNEVEKEFAKSYWENNEAMRQAIEASNKEKFEPTF